MTLTAGRFAQLWGGPEDGGTVWLPPAGDLPARLGILRDARGQAVTLRGRAMLDQPATPAQVAVYEHLTLPLLRAWCELMGQDPAGYTVTDTPPVYLWRDLVTLWTSR